MSIYEDAKRWLDSFGRGSSAASTPDAKFAREVVRLTEALQHVVDISDERDLPRNDWRVVERMRKVAIGTIGNERTDT